MMMLYVIMLLGKLEEEYTLANVYSSNFVFLINLIIAHP